MRVFVLLSALLFGASVWGVACGPSSPDESSSEQQTVVDGSQQEGTSSSEQVADNATGNEQAQPPEREPVDNAGTTEQVNPPKDEAPTKDEAPAQDEGSKTKVDFTPIGSRVEEFFKDDKYKSLLIEVDYAKGYKPSQEALDAFKAKLEELRSKSLFKKPGGIQIKIDQEITDQPPAGGWKIADLQQLEFNYRQNMPGGTQAVAYFLYVGGNWHEDSSNGRVLGIAYSGSTMTVFKKTVDDVCSSASIIPGTTQKLCRVVEASIVLHEFAHIIGMTNLGLKMTTNHEDEAHKGHCNNKDCVNYWTNNQSSMAGALGSVIGSAPDVLPFGKECLDDMAAIHNP
ncbi:MAG: hypothetical protein EP343_20740 [Deltaproteobacteria bacterium]|nr:MAG: hypothetical protein EP343_20740 [Deltaproteobacteria bacterium]